MVPMRFPPGLLDEIRARLPVSHVVGRKVALKKRGREFSGLSPFKPEKTPSFFVNDHKGFYHCFASGEHGDIFTFVMKTEGLAFPEAVERLAAEAGVRLPKPDARDEAREDARTRLLALMEVAAKFFETQLRGAVGEEARRYTRKRGLKSETLEKFRIGYAPNSRSALKEHLARAGYTHDEMVASGMLIAGDDIPVAYDRFRHRLMFPIVDLKGRIIAFGGRALDPDAPAKYLNSPETPLFHKGNLLFNAHRARTAAHDRGRIIAVEGYMDAISLAEAGFEETVAPLGTALTENQLRLLWRMSPEPILCFDGDRAGRRAAFRAIDTALPHLKPAASLSFAFLPDGLDPDDLVRQQGASAFEHVIGTAQPLSDVLWQREWEGGQWSTPERRAQLEQRLGTLINAISDLPVRQHYMREMRGRLATAWRSALTRPSSPGHSSARPPLRQRGGADRRVREYGDPRRQRAFDTVPSGPSRSLKQSRLVGSAQAPPYREVLMVRTLLNHPWLVDEHAEQIAAITFSAPALAQLRDAVLMLKSHDISLDSSSMRSQLEALDLHRVLETVERAVTHRSDKFAEPDADRDEVDVGWRHTLAVHEREVDLRRDLEAAERAFQHDGTEQSLARICEIQRLIARSISVDVSTDS
jgi:DNA primase